MTKSEGDVETNSCSWFVGSVLYCCQTREYQRSHIRTMGLLTGSFFLFVGPLSPFSFLFKIYPGSENKFISHLQPGMAYSIREMVGASTLVFLPRTVLTVPGSCIHCVRAIRPLCTEGPARDTADNIDIGMAKRMGPKISSC